METKNKLKSFFTEHWKYMAVSTACKLNLFDHLQEEKTAKQLANELSLNEEKLLLLLNALQLHAYHKAMYEYAKDDYRTLPDLIDFSKYKSVMDVGGNYGAVLENIKAKNPNVECILFDLEKVIKNITVLNIQKRSGSFFDKIPSKSEAIILSRILHDWNNEKADIILKNCFEALPNNGTLCVIENCADKIKVDLSLLSLNMTAMCESYERTSTQYISLAENAGFYFECERELNELQTILIFKK